MELGVLTFEQALDASTNYKKRHLLLGNGFSIACRPDIFRYEKLFEQADFSLLSTSVREAFHALGTTDFERVIRALRDSAKISSAYDVSDEKITQMRSDADALKELLVQTIADSHPEYPALIQDEEYAACQLFLDNFSTTYTLNYDLLIYWTHMHREKEGEIVSDDGFRTSQDDIESGSESDYVIWDPSQSHEQNMWFLHGAMHVFDSGTEVQKYTWKRTGVRLIEQIRKALDRNLFPLFVAEGTSDEKLERVKHSDYLAKAYRSFQAIRSCLFIFGHSLAANDEHYLQLIDRGKVSHVFIGLYGNPSSTENQRTIRRAKAMTSSRGKRWPLKVSFYDSASVEVWG